MSILFDTKIDMQDGSGVVEKRFFVGVVSSVQDCQIFEVPGGRIDHKLSASLRSEIVKKAKRLLSK